MNNTNNLENRDHFYLESKTKIFLQAECEENTDTAHFDVKYISQSILLHREQAFKQRGELTNNIKEQMVTLKWKPTAS